MYEIVGCGIWYVCRQFEEICSADDSFLIKFLIFACQNETPKVVEKSHLRLSLWNDLSLITWLEFENRIELEISSWINYLSTEERKTFSQEKRDPLN